MNRSKTSLSRAFPKLHGLCGVALFAALVAWTVFVNPTVSGAIGDGNITVTTSTSSHTSIGCPAPPFAPDCSLNGMTLTCVSFSVTFGPTCIGIGNLDLPNTLPCSGCGGGCETPPFGTPHFVPAGKENIDTNTDTTTFLCKPALAPALAPWALMLLLTSLGVFGVWRLWWRSVRA